MKTPEQILSKLKPNAEYPCYYHESVIVSAMEEYAAQFKQPPTPATVEEAAKEYADMETEAHRLRNELVFQNCSYWDGLRQGFIAGHSHKGEGWVRVEKFREMAEALDKPVLNMLKKQNIGFDKWSENIHRLVEKELGFRKISVYEPLPQPPKTDKP